MKSFFILAIGRSGTQFLASLLSKSPGALVYHEPEPEDRIYFGLRYYGNFDKVVDNYLEKRFQKLLPKNENYKIYGETNSYLRYEVDWLKNKFNPVLIHLVRDGREFVRSAYTRDVYTINHKDKMIVPQDNDPFAGKWGKMNRFRKLCWYWKHTNEFLSSRIEKMVCFEKLLTDYDYFKNNILTPTGLEISFDTWKREIKKPENTSKRYIFKRKVKRTVFSWKKSEMIKSIPHWSQWDSEKTKQFNEICFETMKKLGYF